MAILRTQRNYPLALKDPAQYALNSGIVAAYDFQGNPNNAFSQGDGAPHVGTHALTKTGMPTVVEAAPGIFGRDTSQGLTVTTAYFGTNILQLGFGSTDGKGNFTIHKRMRAPTVTTTTSTRTVLGFKDGGGTKLSLAMVEATTAVFFKFTAGAVVVPANEAAPTYTVPLGQVFDLHLVREVDTLSVYLNGTLIASAAATALLTYNTANTGSNPNNGTITAPPSNLILIDDTYWNRALSSAEVSQHASDPYAGYTNTAIVPDGVNVTNPAPSTTVNSEGFQIGGTYSGATVPTGFQYRFNGGSWTALNSVTIGGGNFSGTTGFVTAATGTLEVRFTNATSVTDSVALITAQAPAPTVSLTSQSAPDGQNVTFVLATTRANSVAVTLNANGNGAVTQGPFTQPVSDNAATVALTGIPPGDYTVAISATGSGGTAAIAGSPISILGASGGGDPIGSDPGDTEPPVMTGAITLSQIKETSFSANWTGATDNVDVTGYEYSLGGEYLPLGLVTTYLFNNQAVGTPFSLSVRAFDGAGLRSNVLTAADSTLPAQAPGAPTDVTATLQSGQTVSVAFVPSAKDIENPVTTFTVRASNGQMIGGMGSPIEITVPAGFVGTFRVSATNVVDESPDSDPSNSVSVPVAIGAPTVNAVIVTPAIATGSQAFSAVVSGANGPSQAVTWAASSGTIDGSGVFTAPATTALEQVVTVTARSVLDATKAGSATVTIAAAEVIQVATSCTVNFGGANRLQPSDPYFKNNKWYVPKDPEDERYYKFGFAKDLTEAGTTAILATAIYEGVEVLVPPAIQGSDVIIKLGSLGMGQNAENFCTMRVDAANGEQFDRTMHFVREDH